MNELSEFNLARCRHCRRILLAEHLEKGRCRPGNDCWAAEMMAKAWTEAPPGSCPLFARNVEMALLAVAGLVTGVDGLTEGARGLVESFALAI